MHNQLKDDASNLLAEVRDVLFLTEKHGNGPSRHEFETLDEKFGRLRKAVLDEQAELDVLARVLSLNLDESGESGRHLAPFRAVLTGPSRLTPHVLNNVSAEMAELYLAWAHMEFKSGNLGQAARALGLAMRTVPFDPRAKALLAALRES